MFAIRLLAVASLIALAPQVGHAQARSGPPAPASSEQPDYLIGVGDMLHVFVWKNPELSTDVPVRPDGKITTPLVQDLEARGKTSSQLAVDLREALSRYIQDPNITVVVKSFAAPSNAAAIRVVGAAVTPKIVPYRVGLTVLDVMIDVGGLNTFASGNRAALIRQENGAYREYPLHLADLVEGGDLRANRVLMPGDVVRIPERWF
ncbi:XrtA/PEP-CTERM system exopolysaccharide export protein [Caulobacter segnis]